MERDIVLAVAEEPVQTWEAALAKSVGNRVAQFRKQRGLTAQQLSEQLRDRLGLDLKRTVIGNLESGYRHTISYAEILALAYVLEVPPLLLMVPIGTDDFQPLPGVSEEPWESAMWITGEGLPLACEDPTPEMIDRYLGHMDYLRLYRQHTDFIGQWTRALHLPDPAVARAHMHEVEKAIALVRASIRERGGVPPRLPEELQGIDQRHIARTDPPGATGA
jgi:transcriptional regulator with XRE-family HTH domain